MWACMCFAVTLDELDATISDGARSVDEVGERCGAGTGCGSCKDRIRERLQTVAADDRQLIGAA